MGDIRLFVSHSHDDKKIAAALVDVIEAALERPRPSKDQKGQRILCTSHRKREYRYGKDVKDVSEDLKTHLSQSAVVLGVITPNSLKSPWCLFELGGAWVLAKQTYLLIAEGLPQKKMPAALKGRVAAKLTKPKDIKSVLANLIKDLDWKSREDEDLIAKKIDSLVKTVRKCT